MFGLPLLDIFGIFALLCLGICFIIPKKKGYEYTKLDKAGFILNIVLSAAYLPMSLMGIFTIFFFDDPNLTKSQANMLGYGVALGVLLPIIATLCILTSVITRKRAKSKFSFAVQFVPLVQFAVMIGLCIAAAFI